MSHRLTRAILRVYPPPVRNGHGPEIMELIDDLIAHDRRSRIGLYIRLAVDGLVQRIASTATIWSVVGLLAATSLGGLAVSDFAAATALHAVPLRVHAVAPAHHTHQTPRHRHRWHRTSHRSAGTIAGRFEQRGSTRSAPAGPASLR